MDERTFDIDTQFMWGSSLIIAPIIDPGVSVRSVYLPESETWYDLYSMTRIQGGERMAVSTFPGPAAEVSTVKYVSWLASTLELTPGPETLHLDEP